MRTKQKIKIKLWDSKEDWKLIIESPPTHRSHPLMDTAVSHENEKPIYYKRDLFFTRLVVDRVKVDMMGHQLDYTVYYAGTSKYNMDPNTDTPLE